MKTELDSNYLGLTKKFLLDTSNLDSIELGTINTDSFQKYLQAERLLTLIVSRVTKEFPEFKLSSELQTLFSKQATFNFLLGHHADQLIKTIQAAKIPVIELKGRNLSKELYNDSYFRDSGDIDLLIHLSNYSEVCKILKELEFEPQLKLNKVQSWLNDLTSHSLEFTNSASGIKIDLHWRLVERYYASDLYTKDFWAQASYPPTNLTQLPQAESHFNLIFLCLQAYKEQYQSIARLYEVYLLSRSSKIKIAKLHSIAQQYDLDGIVGNTISAANKFFNKSLEQNIIQQSEFKVLFSNRKKMSSYLSVVFFRFLLPFGSDFNLQLPAALTFLYFPIKYLRLFFRACQTLQNLWRKR